MANIKDNISRHNLKAYMDIATDMFAQKKGIFTFIVRIDGKKVVDYVQLELINYGNRLYGQSAS